MGSPPAVGRTAAGLAGCLSGDAPRFQPARQPRFPRHGDDAFRMHCLHCLFLTHRLFPPGSRVVDWGTGGGLPAIPLAIAQPEISVLAVDANGGKVQAVRAMIRRLGLTNVEVRQARAETLHVEADYSTARAVAPLKRLWTWHRQLLPGPARAAGASAGRTVSAANGETSAAKRVLPPPDGIASPADGAISSTGRAASPPGKVHSARRSLWTPGLICLKGGDLAQEITAISEQAHVERIPLEGLDARPWFQGKSILACTARNELPDSGLAPSAGT